MMDILPHELILQVLASLHPADLRSVKLLSHAWLAFFAQYGETIYKATAILHGYAEPGVELRYIAQATEWLDDVASWEELCKRQYTVDRAWKGKGLLPAHIRLKLSGHRARSFFVVPSGRFVLVAQEIHHNEALGAILAVDINTDTVLWRIPEVRIVATRLLFVMRYDADFLVLERERNSGLFEVWRRAPASGVGQLVISVPVQCAPDSAMRSAHAAAWRADASSARGAFVPHALLRIPDAVSSIGMAGRNLFLLSRHAIHVYVYDVATAALAHTFDCHPNDTKWGKLCAVDVDPCIPHPLLVTAIGRTVFASSPIGTGVGEPRTVLSFPSSSAYRAEPVARPQDLRGHSVYRLQVFRFKATPSTRVIEHEPRPEIFKVRVSRTGGHVVMVTNLGTLVVARGCLRHPDAGAPPQVSTVSLEVAPQFLCFEDHRIAIGSSQGIFITDIDLSALVLLTSHPRYPRMAVELHMTQEALWVLDTTWSLVRGRHRGNERDPVVVHYFTFANPRHESDDTTKDRLPSATPSLLGRLNAAILDALG
ncbi:hypothetical protein AURDEDRAFT_152289 [Auricularia subglabra TFB-10046 SS5]|nr:hypothetical protein AURDEDRAFT_152289 [Auricularia subglabra TFB-10046 SS5]